MISGRSGIQALLVVFFLSGCGGGGGGSGGTVVDNPVRIDRVSVTPSQSGTLVSYDLVSPDQHSMAVEVQYSEDRGLSYHPATVSAGELTGLDAGAQGTTYQLTWATPDDLDSLHQSDLRIRLTPRDEVTGNTGAAVVSEVFGIGSNTPPQIDSMVTPVGPVGGQVLVSFVVSDAEEDVVGLQGEFSLDGGSSWNAATPGDQGDGTVVTTLTTGDSHQFAWFGQIDAPNVVTNVVRFRLRAVDVGNGPPSTTSDFSVNFVAPRISLVTLGDVTTAMNGSEDYQNAGGGTVSFQLSAPPSGFPALVEYHSISLGGDIDPSTLEFTVDRTLGDLPPATDVGHLFDTTTSAASWTVPADHALPTGVATFTARIKDEYGNLSASESYTVDIFAATPAHLPFDVVDLWWLDFESDLFDIDFTGGASVTVTTTAGTNGVADYQEDLLILGLRSPSPTPASSGIGSNAIVLEWVKTETLGRLRELYGGSFDGSDGGFASGLQFTSNGGTHRSVIRVGGDDSNSGFTIGRAQFDYRNDFGNTNHSPTLGIFTTNVIQFYINTSFMFKSRFDPLIPGRGTPVGEDAVDHVVLASGFSRLDPGNTLEENFRYDQIYNAIDAWARSVAVILAHEIGHSIGLCANGIPPGGLFGGVNDAPFAGPYTTEYHFDSPGYNIMASALSFTISLIPGVAGYQFNGLNAAYLSGWDILR